jgi:hypothetical protein
MATSKDNLVLEKHILDEYDDPVAVENTRYILDKALDK